MRDILLNICLTAVALCLFKMLIPENSMKKQTDFLVACFFLASLVFFFTSGSVNITYGAEHNDINIDIPYINFDEEYTKAQKRAIDREIDFTLSRLLARENIFPQEILTNINISDELCISINEIRLVFLKAEDEENDEEIEILREAMSIVRKEVGESILITGEFKNE